MHTIAAHPLGVTLFMRGGIVRAFKSFEAAYADLGYRWICANVRAQIRSFDGCDVRHTEKGLTWIPRYVVADAIMRDDFGRIITPAVFWHLMPKRVSRRRYDYWNGEGPVPGTGVFCGSKVYRASRYFAARRQAQVVDREEPAPRAARNANNLPGMYDSRYAGRRDRCWKRFRRTQWKA